MRIHDRQKLIDKGIIKKEQKAAAKAASTATETVVTLKKVDSFDQLADIIHTAVVAAPDGYDQGQLMRDLKAQGWEFDDVSIALAILHRKKQIVYVGE